MEELRQLKVRRYGSDKRQVRGLCFNRVVRSYDFSSY